MTTRAELDPPVGLTFTERMVGTLTPGAQDPAAGADDPSAFALVLHARVIVDDVDGFVTPRGRRGRLVATVDSPRLLSTIVDMRPHPAVASGGAGGVVGLFVPDGPRGSTGRVMRYDAPIDVDGRRLWMSGTKIVDPAPVTEGWRATTTLHVRLHDGSDADAPVIAAGVLRLRVGALAALLMSMRSIRSPGHSTGATALGRFGAFFVRCLADTYLRHRAP